MGIKVANSRTPMEPNLYTLAAMERIGKNVFVVQGLSRGKRLLSTKQRNMVVIRQNHAELTLINPIRLCPVHEASLLQLGRFERIIRLGPSLHGSEFADEYYQTVFGARLYLPRKASSSSSLHGDDGDLLANREFIDESTLLPIPQTRIFVFRNTEEPEGALLVDDILITSESLQNQKDNSLVNIPTKAVMQLRGYMDFPVLIKPRWRKQMQGKLCLRDDFERLLRLDFSKLIGASGAIVSSHGKEKAVMAVDTAFPLM